MAMASVAPALRSRRRPSLLVLTLLLLLSLIACDDEPDLYFVLGLDDSATEREIKTAYRKMSLKHHP